MPGPSRAYLLAPLALLLAACGGGGDADGPAPGVAYDQTLREIVERSSARIDEIRDPLDEAIDDGALGRLFDLIPDVTPQLVEAGEGAIEEIERLAPPQRFAADQDRFLQGIRDILLLEEQINDAVAQGDLASLLLLFDDLQTTQRELEAALSPQFRDIVQSFFVATPAAAAPAAAAADAGARDAQAQPVAENAPTAAAATELPDGYPELLIYPGATLQAGFTQPESQGLRLLAIWLIDDDVDAIFDYYAEAFHALSVPGEEARYADDVIQTLLVGDADTGASIQLEQGAAPDGAHFITVSFLVPWMAPGGCFGCSRPPVERE